MKSIHEIDSPSGAFFLMKKPIIDKVGGFDERFFMYGEDLDLALRIREAGFKIDYYPHLKITHLKYRSGLNSGRETSTRTRSHFYQAMKLFFQKHYSLSYPGWFNGLVLRTIDMLARIRK
jgi:GT2 family glycosyltransferase